MSFSSLSAVASHQLCLPLSPLSVVSAAAHRVEVRLPSLRSPPLTILLHLSYVPLFVLVTYSSIGCCCPPSPHISRSIAAFKFVDKSFRLYSKTMCPKICNVAHFEHDAVGQNYLQIVQYSTAYNINNLRVVARYRDNERRRTLTKYLVTNGIPERDYFSMAGHLPWSQVTR